MLSWVFWVFLVTHSTWEGCGESRICRQSVKIIGGLGTPYVAGIWNKGNLVGDCLLTPVESDANSGWLVAELDGSTPPVGVEREQPIWHQVPRLVSRGRLCRSVSHWVQQKPVRPFYDVEDLAPAWPLPSPPALHTSSLPVSLLLLKYPGKKIVLIGGKWTMWVKSRSLSLCPWHPQELHMWECRELYQHFFLPPFHTSHEGIGQGIQPIG